MELVQLGDSGLRVSRVGLGCNNFGGRIGLEETLRRWPEWTLDREHAVPLYTSTVRGYLNLPFAA